MELLVIIPNVYECSEYIGWEYHLEGFPILLYGVEEAQTAEAMQLEFMLDFDIFLWVIEVCLGLFTFIDSRTVLHQDLADNMSAMKSNLDVISII